MKKVVFSLKSIALVAVASLGMVSCGGSDDSSPEPVKPPVVEEPGDGNLTSNYIEWDGAKYKADGSMFEIQGTNNNGNFNPGVYKLNNQEGFYLRYYTTYWKGDMESAQEIADLKVYGMISYYVKLEDVTLDDQGTITDYEFVNPNEAKTILPASGSLYIDGESVGNATGAGIQVNVFTMDKGVGTAAFNAQTVHGNEGTAKIDYNGDSSFSTYVPSSAKGISNFKAANNVNIAKEVKSNVSISIK